MIDWDDTHGRSTGVDRLDDLFGGRLPFGYALLVLGPPFGGKRVVLHSAVAAALRDGAPVTMVCTERTADETRRALADRVEDLGRHERDGAVTYIDTCAIRYGAEEEAPQGRYLDALDPAAVLEEIAAAIAATERGNLVVVDTVSSFLEEAGRQEVYRFLNDLNALARRSGAAVAYALTSGMHSPSEEVLVRHAVDRVVEMKHDYGGRVLRIEGVRQALPDNWIEYSRTEHAIEITGSLSANRIR